MKNNLITLLLTILGINSQVSFASIQPNKPLIADFMLAMNAVYQSQMTNKDIDHYFAFMSADIVDHHVSYNVVQSGKEGRDKARAGLLKKREGSISSMLKIESITTGTATAVVVFNEDAHYYKKGKKKHFIGRTILVLEFNEQGKIAVMRRYQD